MHRLYGTQLPGSPLTDLEWVSDLEYFDGPIVSHLRNNRGGDYLRCWTDCAEGVERWLFALVSDNAILRLANRVETLDRVIPHQCQAEFVYFVDVDAAQETTTLVRLADIPTEYIPGADAFLRPERSPCDRSFPVFYEGNLSLELLTEIPRKFKQAYSVFLLLNKPDVAKEPRFVSHPWHGDGFSSMYFYREVTPWAVSIGEFKVERVKYSSPGFVEFDVHRPTAETLTRCVEMVKDRGSQLSRQYNQLTEYIRSNHLNHLERDSEEWSRHETELIAGTKRLLDAMEVLNPYAIFQATQRPFEAAQIARSIVHRLRHLADFERDGAMKLPRP